MRCWIAPGTRPAAHWPDQPGIIAGRDRSGGGTWMGVNRHGVVAAVLNRPGQPRAGCWQAEPWRTAAAGAGPPIGRRSRRGRRRLGRRRLAQLQPGPGGPGQARSSCAASATAGRRRSRWPPGLHMVTAHDPDDLESPRVARHLRAVPGPRPADPDPIRGWRAGRTSWPTEPASRRRADQCRAARRVRHRLFVAAGHSARQGRRSGCSPPARRTRRPSRPSPAPAAAWRPRPCAAISGGPPRPAWLDGVPPKRGS